MRLTFAVLVLLTLAGARAPSAHGGHTLSRFTSSCAGTIRELLKTLTGSEEHAFLTPPHWDSLPPGQRGRRPPLEKIHPDAPAWSRIFMRSSATVGIPQALDAMIEDTAQSMVYFDRWLHGEEPEDFVSMLRTQHTMITRRYGGFYAGKNSLPSTAYPGKLTYEIIKNTARHPVLPLPLKQLPEHTKPRNRIRIAGIPPRALPLNRRTKGTHASPNWGHKYPKIAHHKHYLKRMKELMENIRTHLDTASDQELLTWLSDYYHVAINCHLFVRVNNSVFMSQVNTILLTRGWKGMPHGHLDYEALSWDFDEFRNIFIRAVIEANATPGTPATETLRAGGTPNPQAR